MMKISVAAQSGATLWARTSRVGGIDCHHGSSRKFSSAMQLRPLLAAARPKALALIALAFAPALHAQVAVGDNGTPSYSQAISVPPGVAGMAPKLSLLYAGGGVNGPLGHGWSVQGLSSITRCPAIVAIDGARSLVSYGLNDKLCLDGQRLIQTDAAGNPLAFPQSSDAQGLASGAYTEYRTEKDSYARIRAYGYADGSAAANGPSYFRVWTKAGQIYEYGAGPASDANTNALITPVGKPYAIAWPVARISDTLGNVIDFKYEQRSLPWGSGPVAGSPTVGREWNILEIQYSGNKVLFNYDVDGSGNDNRADRSEAYQQGNKNVSSRRLLSITTYVNSPNTTTLGAGSSALAVKTTKLTYENGGISGRSRIKAIQECAGAAASTRCLPGTDLTYADGGSEAYQASASFTSSALGTATLQCLDGSCGVLPGDFNGDGKTDFVLWNTDPTQNKLYLSNGDGTFSVAAGFNLTGATQKLFSTDNCYNATVADFNGDGIFDILRYSVSYTSNGTACTSYGTTKIYLSNGDGSFTERSMSGTLLNDYPDGPLRLVSKKLYDCTPMQPAGVGCAEPGTRTGWSVGYNFYMLDVDGDGKLDLVFAINWPQSLTDTPADQCPSQTCTRVYKGDGQGGFNLIATNVTHQNLYKAPPNIYTRDTTYPVMDSDGDGLSDILGVGNPYVGPRASWHSRGDGNFDQTTIAASLCSKPIDFNGDGRGDCLTMEPLSSSNHLSVGDGAQMVTVANFNLNVAATGTELIVQADTNSPITASFYVADVNNDGRQDILRWEDDATKNAVFLSNGDGSFSRSTNFALDGSASVQLQKSDGTASIVLGDFTGRGTTEILRLQNSGSANTNRLYVKSSATPPDQLVSVTDPQGAKTTLYYVPLTNSTPGNGVSDASLGGRYTSDRGVAGTAVANSVELSLPLYVVATSVADSGVGTSTVNTEYGYLGLKADIQGRGLLGFREVRRQAPAPDGSSVTVDTQYLQVHPYIGVASSTATYVGKLDAAASSLQLSNTVNIYCDQGVDRGDGVPGAVAASATASSPCTVTAKVQRPYVFKTLETGKDLGGNSLPQVVTQNVFNGSGDPRTIAATTTGSTGIWTSQPFVKTTSNLYDPDVTSCSDFKTCNWVLGRLSQAQVNSQVPYMLSTLSTSAGNNPNATATAGSGPLQSGRLPSTLSFGSVTLATTATLPATLVNDGVAPLTVTVPASGSVTGTDFAFGSTDCTGSLAPGGSCTVVVSFTPSAAGARSGTLSVVTGTGTQTSALSGTGTGSKATLTSASTLVVPATWYGATAQTVTATYRNDGNVPMTLGTPPLSSPLSVTSNGCANVAPGASCNMVVTAATNVPGINQSQTFTPTGATVAPAATTVTWTTQIVTATLTTAPSLTVPTAWYGASAQTVTATYRNDGNVAMTLGTPTLSAPLSVTSNGCANVAPASSCNMVVTAATNVPGINQSQTFTPAGATVAPAATTVTWTTQTAVPRWGGTSLSFGNVALNTPSSQNITLFNDGNTAYNWASNSTIKNAPAGYTFNTSACGNVAPSGSGSCTVVVTFNPTSYGTTYAGSNISMASASYDTNTFSVSGTGAGSVATLVSSASQTFAATVQGGAAPQVTWVFRNDGNLNLTMAGGALNSPFSWQFGSCSNIAPGFNCALSAVMSTGSVGTFSQSGISVSGASVGNRSDLQLSGTVSAANTTLVASPTGLSFGTVAKGLSKQLSLTLTNTGSISATGMLGRSYAYTSGTINQGSYASGGGTCGTTLAAGASCSVVVEYDAVCTGGTRNATMSLTGANFPAVQVSLTAATQTSGTCY